MSLFYPMPQSKMFLSGNYQSNLKLSSNATQAVANLVFPQITSTCWSPSTLYTPVDPRDCYRALYITLLSNDILTPLKSNPASDLPITISWETCRVSLTRAYEDADETLTLVLVAHAAAKIVERCLVEALWWRGGSARVPKPNGGYLVTVGHPTLELNRIRSPEVLR